VLGHLDPCLMNPLRHRLATAEKYRPNQKISCEQKVNESPHFLVRHLLSRLCAVCKPPVGTAL